MCSAFQKDRDILLEQARYRHIQLPKAYQSKKALLDFIEKDDKRNKRVLPASAPGPAPAPPVPQPSGSRSRSRSRSQPPDLKRQRTATPELLDYPLSEDEEESPQDVAQPVTRPHGPPSIMAEAAAREARGGFFFLRAFFSVEKIVMTFWRDEDCGKP